MHPSLGAAGFLLGSAGGQLDERVSLGPPTGKDDGGLSRVQVRGWKSWMECEGGALSTLWDGLVHTGVGLSGVAGTSKARGVSQIFLHICSTCF